MNKVASNTSMEHMKDIFDFCGEIGYEYRHQNILRRSLVK